METILIPVENILIKARSKIDIYRMLSIDSKLAVINSFSRLFSSVLWKAPNIISEGCTKRRKEGKKYWIRMNLWLLKTKDVTLKIIPRYKELAVKIMWEYIKELIEIHQYFSDYTQKQIPERDYLFAVVSTLQNDVLD